MSPLRLEYGFLENSLPVSGILSEFKDMPSVASEKLFVPSFIDWTPNLLEVTEHDDEKWQDLDRRVKNLESDTPVQQAVLQQAKNERNSRSDEIKQNNNAVRQMWKGAIAEFKKPTVLNSSVDHDSPPNTAVTRVSPATEPVPLPESRESGSGSLECSVGDGASVDASSLLVSVANPSASLEPAAVGKQNDLAPASPLVLVERAVIDRNSPHWELDESRRTCAACDKKFTFLLRPRHHCR